MNHLPREIWMEMIKYLDNQSFGRLIQTNSYFHNLVSKEYTKRKEQSLAFYNNEIETFYTKDWNISHKFQYIQPDPFDALELLGQTGQDSCLCFAPCRYIRSGGEEILSLPMLGDGLTGLLIPTNVTECTLTFNESILPLMGKDIPLPIKVGNSKIGDRVEYYFLSWEETPLPIYMANRAVRLWMKEPIIYPPLAQIIWFNIDLRMKHHMQIRSFLYNHIPYMIGNDMWHQLTWPKASKSMILELNCIRTLEEIVDSNSPRFMSQKIIDHCNKYRHGLKVIKEKSGWIYNGLAEQDNYYREGTWTAIFPLSSANIFIKFFDIERNEITTLQYRKGCILLFPSVFFYKELGKLIDRSITVYHFN